MKIKISSISLLLSALTLQVSAQSSWNLAADWNPPANPNGAWSYGEMSGGVFVPLAWSGVGCYGNGNTSGGFEWYNGSSDFAYGIDPGQVSLESDSGSAAVQWTAPADGDYAITVAIGGSTASGGGGYGNYYARNAGLNINDVSQSDTSWAGNVMSWDFTDVYLAAGSTVDAFANPGDSGGGNTEAQFSVNEVPEPSTLALSALGGFSLMIFRRRK
jgi:hypothetical protein